MSDYFKCGYCDYDVFEDKGITTLGKMEFKALQCKKCGRMSMLEQVSTKERVFIAKIEMKLGKYELISDNFD